MITTKEIISQPRAVDYPWLGQHKQFPKTVIFFTSYGTGTVLTTVPGSGNAVGFHYNNWEMNNFVTYEGAITIRNSV